MFAAGEAQAVIHRDGVGASGHGRDGGGEVRFIVEQVRHPRDEALRHEFADEGDAARPRRTQVEFAEVAVARPGLPFPDNIVNYR